MKHESKLKHTFGNEGLKANKNGGDHLVPKGISYPKQSSFNAPQAPRTVKAKHEEIHGAPGMKSHGCIDK